MKEIIITTNDLKQEYEIIGPVYYHVSNKGFFTSKLSKLIDKYKKELKQLKAEQAQGNKNSTWKTTFGEHALTVDNRFDKAFYVAARELQEIARKMDADAIIGMRQSIELDRVGFQYFYLQLYGTAVKFK